MPKGKVCPILSIRSAGTACIEEHCGFWVPATVASEDPAYNEGACAFVKIAMWMPELSGTKSCGTRDWHVHGISIPDLEEPQYHSGYTRPAFREDVWTDGIDGTTLLGEEEHGPR